jgi:2-methylcitrate dehydratase PrpD
MNDTLHPSILGLSRKIAGFTHGFRLEQAPASVMANAKLAILDCLGVAVLAGTQEIGDCLRRFARANVVSGNCTVWGMEIQSNARDAALLNGTLAHGLDYDDRNHSTTYTLASSIALTEGANAGGREALEAFIVGREVRASLDSLFSHRGSGIGPGARGWHSNGILGPIASACSASKALKLGTTETLAAIGLAAGSCGALTRDGGTMAKPFRCGHAAATGVTSALLAREGFTSDETALEERYGLLEAVGPLSEQILVSLGKDLGTLWDLGHSLRIKPFASCTATHSGLEAMLRLVQRDKIAPGDVEAMECDLRPYPLVRATPTRGYEGKFSMPFCLAVALLYGKVTPDDFVNERLHEPRIQELIGRTRHLPKEEVLTVTLKNGKKLSEPFQPPTNLTEQSQISEKFAQSLSRVFSPERTRAIADHVMRLEELTSIRVLTDLLRTSSS